MTDEGRVHPLAPVVAFDIDGHLGEYHRHFVWFLNNIYFPRRYNRVSSGFQPVWTDEIKGEFNEALSLDKHVYRAAKMAYRQGGLKRSMPTFPFDNLRAEIQGIREMGVQVWITTSRPWMRLDNVDPDTQYWLENNTGRIDGLIFGEDKYADLIDIVGHDRILGISDDLPENIERAKELNLNSALRVGNHNAWWVDEKDLWDNRNFIFNEMPELTKIVTNWKDQHFA